MICIRHLHCRIQPSERPFPWANIRIDTLCFRFVRLSLVRDDGEVGLIFAGAGLAAGVIAEDLYSALIVVVMLTTFAAPPWLKALYRDSA